jgi:iron(III) transport system substrate-binding protein
MKRALLIILAILCISSLIIGGCTKEEPTPSPSSTATKSALDALIERANAEGELIIRSSEEPGALTHVIAAWEARYPEIKLTIPPGIPGPQVPERVIAEYPTGKVSWDVNCTPLWFALPLSDRDMLARYDWTGIPVNQERLLLDGRAAFVYDDPWNLLYNTNALSEAELPHTWEELLEPKYAGKVVLMVPVANFTALTLAWGEERTKDYIQELYDAGSVISYGNDSGADMVIREECWICNESLSSSFELIDKGEPVAILPISPQFSNKQMFVAFDRCQHPNAAQLWLYWLTTDEAIQAWEADDFGRVSPGITTTRAARTINELGIVLYSEDTVEQAREDLSLLEEYSVIMGAVPQ